ncbi:MAG: calcium-binding protein [Woeseiaceae bacterium]
MTKSVRQPIRIELGAYALTALFLAGCGSSSYDDDPVVVVPPPPAAVLPIAATGSDLNNLGSVLLSLNPQGPGGSPNQSLRSGDIFQGGPEDEVLIGALGVDLLIGNDGDDVLIGGTEDFNSSVDGDDRGADNRDRAFGGNGDDTFIWAPGDGSDFFDGGSGVDVLIFGVLGEERDADGSVDGAPFFNVNPPSSAGAFDFDGIFLDAESGLPTARVSASPGFCTVLDDSTNADELATLSLDQLVRFSLRGIANAFDAGDRTDDDGLRVAVSVRNTEFLVCTNRDIIDGGGTDNIQVLDLTTSPPTVAALTDLPDYVQQMID